MKNVLSVSCVVLALQGCAFTTAHLDVGARPNANLKGPLSEVPPETFELKPLEDARADKARIGYKKNGYGSNTADILSNRPVTDVLVDAVTLGLRQNGHNVGAPSNVIVTGSVSRFWFEFKPNFWTVEFTGNVECDLDFVSAKSGKSLYKARYSGTYTEKTGGGMEKTWTVVMDSAVEKFVEDIVFDSALIEALKDDEAQPAPSAASNAAAPAAPAAPAAESTAAPGPAATTGPAEAPAASGSSAPTASAPDPATSEHVPAKP